MKILLVKIIGHEDGWKGTWYETGQEHFVVEYRAEYLAQAYHAIDTCGGINEEDCELITGVRAWIKCQIKHIKIKLRLCDNWAKSYS